MASYPNTAEAHAIPERFTTKRLTVRNWQGVIADPATRPALEAALTNMLTPPVLDHLPPSFQVDPATGALSSWIDARAEESDVLLIEKTADALIGLMILVCEKLCGDLPTVHLGYLLAETASGRGLATELVRGFVAEMESRRPVKLVGGVGRENAASARVLQKAGFSVAPDLGGNDTDVYAIALA
jgi:RimJ/RimL family protein N-acetyltransferase